jgi:hypothetical protein
MPGRSPRLCGCKYKYLEMNTGNFGEYGQGEIHCHSIVVSKVIIL